MKKKFLSLIVVLCTMQLALAQDGGTYQMETSPRITKKVRYSGLVEAMPYYGIFNWANNTPFLGLCIGTSHGIQFFDRFFYGLGIGINIENSHIYVPYYNHIRLDLSKEQARSFISASLGFQIGCYTDTDSAGFWSNIMYGYQFKNRLYIAAGFTMQKEIDLFSGLGEYGIIGMIASTGIKF